MTNKTNHYIYHLLPDRVPESYLSNPEPPGFHRVSINNNPPKPLVRLIVPVSDCKDRLDQCYRDLKDSWLGLYADFVDIDRPTSNSEVTKLLSSNQPVIAIRGQADIVPVAKVKSLVNICLGDKGKMVEDIWSGIGCWDISIVHLDGYVKSEYQSLDFFGADYYLDLSSMLKEKLNDDIQP